MEKMMLMVFVVANSRDEALRKFTKQAADDFEAGNCKLLSDDETSKCFQAVYTEFAHAVMTRDTGVRARVYDRNTCCIELYSLFNAARQRRYLVMAKAEPECYERLASKAEVQL